MANLNACDVAAKGRMGPTSCSSCILLCIKSCDLEGWPHSFKRQESKRFCSPVVQLVVGNEILHVISSRRLRVAGWTCHLSAHSAMQATPTWRIDGEN